MRVSEHLRTEDLDDDGPQLWRTAELSDEVIERLRHLVFPTQRNENAPRTH